MRVEPLTMSLRGGWTLIQRDPIGVLAPTAGLLLLQVGIVFAVQAWWGQLGIWTLVLVFVALSAARVLVATPLRATALAAGARQIARPFAVWRASPGLALIWLLGGGLELLLVGGTLATALMPAWWLLARGTYWGAVLLMILTAPAALVLGVAARTAFAYAVIEVTAGARPPGPALSEGLRKAARDWPALLAILVSGDALTALGSLLCGAGALPGLPFADLALLHRWASLEDEP